LLGSGRDSALIGAVAKTALDAADDGHPDAAAAAGAVGDAMGKPRQGEIAALLIGGVARPADDADAMANAPTVRCTSG
jgi:hypothetical protein